MVVSRSPEFSSEEVENTEADDRDDHHGVRVEAHPKNGTLFANDQAGEIDRSQGDAKQQAKNREVSDFIEDRPSRLPPNASENVISY